MPSLIFQCIFRKFVFPILGELGTKPLLYLNNSLGGKIKKGGTESVSNAVSHITHLESGSGSGKIWASTDLDPIILTAKKIFCSLIF